ncbi:glutamate synthase large subunit [Hyphococcus luteus]|uniref:Glutamate synthase [NADPH] large chain n=1 Tax=Hyphococcus luteus TaxID=2058213 RepID=A0A2S7JZ87_9PROT|nr:glutamate synthase large subunit [Marinicaulis flavus]PQA85563.1 glutamate synthase large subunit [Marinicaulis flavus]
MTDCVSTYLRRRDRLIEANAYDPSSEHDACGVGLVVALDAEPRREIVDMAIEALKAVWHRGAVDADGKTGDGAGIRLNVPQDLFRSFVERTGHKAGEEDICVGMVFLPRTNFGAQDAARAIVESEILHRGFYIYGWRQVPVQSRVLGDKANATRPAIEQILFCDPKGRSQEELDRILYVVRRRIEKRAREKGLHELYVCSLSSQDIVYKGMFLAEEIDNFYTDLKDPRFISRVAIFHQRYSTNTFPEWRLAQPFRMLAHNGEINTLKGNVNWMKSHEIPMAAEVFGDDGEDIKPVIQPGSSDSATLDQVFELLVRAGRTAPMAKTLLIPEAWSKRLGALPDKWRALYEYCNAVMEPWDGPAAIAAYDGKWAVAGLDRNGLRPLRYAITEDGILAVGSETGMCPLDGREVKKRGALEPGRMIAVDLESGEYYGSGSIVDLLADKHPYTEWLENIVELEQKIGPGPEERLYEGDELLRRQGAAGYDLEELELILRPMAEDAKETIGSMGDDTPIAVLSENYRPLSHFFRQNFSQVTNPPIDPLREDGVMSLKTRFKNLGNILVTDKTQTDVFVLESPILTNGMFKRLWDYLDTKIVEIDCTYDVADVKNNGEALAAALDRIRKDAEEAVKDGAGSIVLTDERQGPERLAVPMILAAGGVHAHLTNVGVRTYCSIIVRSAECIDSHYAAVLVGVGATVVNPYLAFDSLAQAHAQGRFDGMSMGRCAYNYKKALEAGLLKIISKMGISVISAYRGGCNFEALGLSRTLVQEFFPGMTSRISGIGLAGLEKQSAALHARAWESGVARLPVGGFYRHRRRGEQHILEADLIADLQEAVRNDDASAYARYSAALEKQRPAQIRDLLDPHPLRDPIGVDKVETANDIRRRFVTPGMSLGALSPEAHGALNIAMNRIGAKSVSGEGGEVPERYQPLPNGDNANSAIKQVASGRFGVTAEYLNQCRELEIKVAQGAKPGEGGQLPGFKVTEFIARMRHSTPGVTLISPPPHHDIYSIEDLAQLIYDLKQINPEVRVCVKLVSMTGIGAIAAGVAKAKADIILISGNVGGTGASPQTSIKFAGAPWELGLSEAHQVLTLNNLRDGVTLRTDGGIRTGRDVVTAAMLGAEEYGVGTVSLLALGCLMVRQCHSNTCPVGVCTQDDALRARFTGLPEHVVHLMTFIAEETRQILASLGATSLEEVIGRSDLLDQVSRGAQHLDDLDLNPILTLVDAGERPMRSTRTGRKEVTDTLDQRIAPDLAPFFERREKVQLSYPVKNTDRAIGARTSSFITRNYKREDLTEDHVTIRLKGSAGQSLGAFSAYGLKIIVDGDANDYVGKGLSGATLVVRPEEQSVDRNDAIIGNTCLYGATSGALFAAGRAGGRFAVRNSGVHTVVEGCSANGCEYMTGGVAVILGAVGANFGAGMTGGKAYVYDDKGDFEEAVNPESVVIRGFLDGEDDQECLALIERHWRETKSPKARGVLDDWANARAKFWVIEPREILARQKKLEAAAKSA